MKTGLLIAASLAARVSGAAIEARQRPHTRGGTGPDVGDCGLDAFAGHTSEASLFCSSILKTGVATQTTTTTSGVIVSTTRTITRTVTLAPPPPPSSTPTPTPPPRTTLTPSPSPPAVSSPASTPSRASSSPVSAPSPTASAGCGLVGYTKSTAAYLFDSSGTKNTFATCQAYCKSDSQCKGFGYGEANCLLFNIPVDDNVSYNPMSPYTFYDIQCPTELPVRAKRQIGITLGLPGNNGQAPSNISSACSCLITSAPADRTVTATLIVINTSTKSDRVTTTVTVSAS